jgi:hypothetical protein
VTPRLLLRLEVVRFALTSSSDASSRGRPDPRDSQGDMNSDSRTAYGLSRPPRDGLGDRHGRNGTLPGAQPLT